MAQNIQNAGATYNDVPSINVPKVGGGYATFTEPPSGTISITQNGTHDVTNYASANVNVSGGDAITVPISTNKNLDIDFSEHELYQGFTGDGALSANRVIHTGITIGQNYKYNIEIKFRKTELQANKDENFISTIGNDYTKLRIGITRNGNIFCRGWNRTNITSPSAVSLNEDHIVKLQYNNGTVSMYIDNVFVASNSVSETMQGGELLIGTFTMDGTSVSSTFLGTLYYIKMTDATHNDSVVLDWDKTIASENDKPLIFINGGDYTNILELPYHTLYGETGRYIDGANPLNVAIPTRWGATLDDLFLTATPATPTLHDIVIPAGEFNRNLPQLFENSGIKSLTATGPSASQSGGYNYYRMLANCQNLESINLSKGATVAYPPTYAFYQFAYQCTALKHVNWACLTAISNSQVFSDAFNGCTNLEDIVLENITSVYGNNAIASIVRECPNLTKFSMPDLTSFGSSGSGHTNFSFRNCTKMYDESINRFQFPVLVTIGGSTTSAYSAFKYAFVHDTASYQGKCHILFPSLTTIANRNSTTTNGHFSYCNALGKIYLPKFTTDGTTGKNIFTNSTNLTEIHFGIENQATIEALAGYSSKFGATNATLYFDMPNHITVNGTVYDRNGLNYDYDNSYYSWINGSIVIYTTNAINPAIGDTVYTKSGDTYSASGTVEAIS